jgi:hypothetical protein
MLDIIWYRSFSLGITQKIKTVNTQNYGFACCFTKVYNYILTITKGHMLRVFNYRVTRNITGPRTNEVTGDHKK